MKKCCDLYYQKYINSTGELILQSYLEVVTLYLHHCIQVLNKNKEIPKSLEEYHQVFDNLFDQNKLCKCSCHIIGKEVNHEN